MVTIRPWELFLLPADYSTQRCSWRIEILRDPAATFLRSKRVLPHPQRAISLAQEGRTEDVAPDRNRESTRSAVCVGPSVDIEIGGNLRLGPIGARVLYYLL
jgi:hypothetical protein